MSYLVSFCSCVFSPFSIAITSLGEERANLSAFRTFVRNVLVLIRRFPLLLGVWEGLRFVIVALPGLSLTCFYSLLLCGLFYQAVCFMTYLVLFCSCVFSPFSIAITLLGEERANLIAFCTFVRFVFVWFCGFPLPPGVWKGLRLVIVALPGFSLTFFFKKNISCTWKLIYLWQLW